MVYSSARRNMLSKWLWRTGHDFQPHLQTRIVGNPLDISTEDQETAHDNSSMLIRRTPSLIGCFLVSICLLDADISVPQSKGAKRHGTHRFFFRMSQFAQHGALTWMDNHTWNGSRVDLKRKTRNRNPSQRSRTHWFRFFAYVFFHTAFVCFVRALPNATQSLFPICLSWNWTVLQFSSTSP